MNLWLVNRPAAIRLATHGKSVLRSASRVGIVADPPLLRSVGIVEKRGVDVLEMGLLGIAVIVEAFHLPNQFFLVASFEPARRATGHRKMPLRVFLGIRRFASDFQQQKSLGVGP